MPNMSSAVSNACLLCVAVVLGEFTVANLLNFENLQVAISILGTGNASVSIALAVLSLVFVFVFLLVLSFLARSLSRRRAQRGPEMSVLDTRPIGAVSGGTRTAAEVRLEELRRQYGSTVALDGLEPLHPGRRAGRPAGSLRVRQDHGAPPASPGWRTRNGGRVVIDGRDVTHLPPNRRDTGMVFQAYSLSRT